MKREEQQMENAPSPKKTYQFIANPQDNVMDSGGLKDVKFIFKHNLR